MPPGAIQWAFLFPGMSAFGGKADVLHGPPKSPLIAKRRHWRYPKEVAHRSLTTLREKLLKIDARVVRHGRYITFQLAEVAVSRQVFGQILARIARLRAPPVPA